MSGGKLLKVRVRFDSEVRRVWISGDFFLHPEEAIGPLERALVGMPLPLGEEEAMGRLDGALREMGARPVGFSTQDLVRTVAEATR